MDNLTESIYVRASKKEKKLIEKLAKGYPSVSRYMVSRATNVE